MSIRRISRLALEIAATLMVAVSAQALPILSEFYYDAPGSDDGQSFVELAGLPGTSLEGFVLEGINGSNGAVGPTIVLAGSIGASGLFVVADQMSDGSTMVVGAELLRNFDIQNAFQNHFSDPQVLVFTTPCYLCQSLAGGLRVSHAAAHVSLLCHRRVARLMNSERDLVNPVSELQNDA